MEREFWLDRWVRGNTGWHQGAPHPFLVRHGDWLVRGEPPGPRPARVFVPLCGASVDMTWLREHGADVVGIDVSPLALERYFDEAGLAPRIDRTCLFERWSADGIELLAGDLFDADATVLGNFEAVYDRAALFALPPDLRARYAARMAELCRPGTRVLLVTFEYDQAETPGPPFAVLADELAALYAPAFSLRPLERLDVLADNPGLRGKGVTALFEVAWELVRR